ncbi:MAG TPA: L-aspartate oxidase, partial [Jatrophihabitantaceae bacterium]|nr:L-aspartate oxidase [Jatrophihabitantaceae bacterium]
MIPRRLRAPEPGWTVETDVVVVGSGIAGLTTALHIARQSALRVLVVTKDVLAAGSTRWAQGGIAAALSAEDSSEQHYRDTITAGAGVCDEAAVRVLVREGPAAVRELAQMGARFDRARDGSLALTREGGHHRDRIAHAGGDATGAEIERALVTRVLDATDVEVVEHALVLDLLRDASGGVAGLTLHVMGEGQRDGVGAVRARAVVLATGGIGQVFASTTNPAVSTGDGVAAALRAGAVVRDLEFVQFHPTVAWLGPQSRGQQPLVSEAVRGEGAFLVDDDGARFMQGQHELADLAPRDVVAKAILRRMRETGAEHMWLDARHFGAEKWRVRFPTIYATLISHGIDPVHALIPVVPASHYASGGIRTNLSGESSLPGLFACGETACTGVHGANRLASNSLLEGLVYGRRIAETVIARLREPVPPGAARPADGSDGLMSDDVRPALQQLMSRHVGVLRDLKGLDEAERGLAELGPNGSDAAPSTENWEATNLYTVARTLVQVAKLREETRGS